MSAGGQIGNDCLGGLPQALNSQLRTGMDMGSPTISLKQSIVMVPVDAHAM